MAEEQLDIFPQTFKAGGGFEGASNLDRALSTWYPDKSSADVAMLSDKEDLDARSLDLQRNDGFAVGAADKYRDSIVGSHFKLNADPDWRHLGLSEEWAEEFQLEVESKFTLWAESLNCWVDATGVNTFTGLVRLAVGGMMFSHGEILATAEWIRDGRPYNTAIQMIDPARLSNPDGKPDSRFLRGGKQKNQWGRTTTFWFRSAHPNDLSQDYQELRWKPVPAYKPWGRKQVIHIMEQMRVDQSRSVGVLVSTLKEMRTRRKLTDMELQNIVLNAMYAASLETDLPADVAASIVGGDGIDAVGDNQAFTNLVKQYTNYYGGKNVFLDGLKVPVLPPGTKMKMQRAAATANPQFSFEKSLLRYMARATGMSYEEFSGDFTETNYSSARAAMGETWKMYQAKRKMGAERFATEIFALWLEEAISKGDIDNLPKGFGVVQFNQGMNKEALTRCRWLGAPKPIIDPEKEIKSDLLALAAGVTTYEKVCAKYGEDYRDTLKQRLREQKMIKADGLEVNLSTTGAGGSESEEPSRGKDGKFAQPEEDNEQETKDE